MTTSILESGLKARLTIKKDFDAACNKVNAARKDAAAAYQAYVDKQLVLSDAEKERNKIYNHYENLCK